MGVGQSDFHAETGTYRRYLVFRLAFIPVAFLGAYRVYETSRGSLVFLGRHPLPGWARAINATWILVVGAIMYLAAQALTKGLG